MLTAFTSSRDESNVGVTFSLSATYNGRIVDVNVIAADAEEAGRTEIVQFETDGTKWEQFMALNLQKDIDDKTAKGVYPSKESDVNADGRLAQAGYNPKDWVNLDEKGKPIAYGTNTFGANYTSMGSKNSLPIALSQNVKTLSMYLNSAGAQAGTIGFMIYDGGDAPQSYGSAQHIIGDFNKEVIKDGVKTQVTATQPYLGNVKGDPDFRSTKTDPSGGWVLDDLITSEKYKETPLESGKTIVTTDKGVTGKYLLLPNGNAVIEKSDNTRVLLNQGDVIEMANPVSKLPIRGVYNHTTGALGEGTLGDEGESQLLDPAVATEYKLRQAQGNEYVLEGVRANLGVNNDKAYIRGWVDFNNNGKFDLNESSEIVEVNQNGTYNIKFKNTPQLLDTSADSLGVRLRISLTKDEILEPTGVASSGEVEDFQTHVVHMPRGTRYETKDYQGREQTVTLSTNAMFIANGKNKDSKFTKWAQIENENLSPKIVLTDKQVASEEAIADKSGLPANYRVDSTGKVHVERNGATVYSGEYVTVKDKNNKVLGKGLKVTNPLTGKTEYLLSEYTEYDTAGNEVGTYKVNPANEGKNTSVGNGLYETTLTFKPNKSYVGTAKGIAVRAWDDNNNSTGWEANNDTIEASKISTTLAEKDKVLENTNNGNNGYKTMDTSYIPTVIDVRPIGEDTTTTDVQGKKQSARPQIPVYGTVETETGDKITDSRYADEFEIIDKNKSIKLADTLDSNKSSYDKDTEVSKATTLTLADGKVVTYTPDKDKLPARAKIAEDADVVVTGTGSVVVNNVRLVTGKTIPAGASPVDPHPVTADTVVTLANGTETTISAGGRIPAGAKLKNPLVTTANNTWNNVTYNTGDTIPRESGNKISTLAKETAISQIVGKGDVVKVDGKYRATNTIPAGTKVKRILPLNQVILPSATHLDPTTGAITEVPRSYDLANTNDSKVTITGEGVYELVKDASGKPTGEVTFTPEPGFVGRGTGVDLVQPDIDYNDVVANDKVTEKYGTDYGRAKYTPIVTPVTEASITRTIHYVYESDNDATATSQASYKNNDPILSINNEPVTRSQTLNYTRTYKMFDEDGVLDQPMVTANTVRDVNGTEYTAGTEIPKGTKFSQGTLIISDWKHGENNEEMNSIVSPTVKGYTANVVTLEYNAPNATGEMAHIKDTKEIGTYKPIDRNTKDVGTYKPASSAIRSDDKDNFDMYVVYKADIQKAKVTYIDLDATGDARILEVQTAATAPATGADAKTTYGVTTLQGKSHTKIPYLTADTIKKYEDLGYELVTDDYTNNTQGTAIEGGRKFDDDKDVDQAFNVYLRHKKVLRQIKDTQEVTRTIEYKYASTDDVPADKRGTTAAPTVTETLHFERDRTIDYTLAAKEYPAEYAAYKAVLDASRYDSPEEYKARTVYYDYITNKAIAADATAAQKAIVTFGPWTPVGGTATGVTLTPAEVAKDDKFNLVNSPEVTGYTPDNATVEATAAIDAEADDYKITVLYTPVAQKAVVKFVEVDPTNTDKVITPGLADPIAVTGKSEAAYPATTATSVTDKIAELVKKGYELVNNGFVSTDKFDKDAAVDQEYVVKFKAKVVDIPSFDPTKPASNENPKPTPGVTPIDPNNPDGPKWTEALINAVKVQEEVTRTIKYVYEDGTPVAESDLTSVADKKVKTLKFTRPGKINVATGEITYGDWSANQTFEAVTSPVLEKYTATVAGVTPTTANVPEKTVAATDKDFEEVVVYKTKLITVDPKAPNYKEPKKDQPINPSDPNGPKWTDELLAKLKNNEEVTRTITYTYSTEASELNQAEKDGNKGGTNVVEPVTTKVNYTRVAKVNPVTGEITYGDWEAKNNDTTLEGNALPAVAGYVATGDVETSVKPVENVKAEDKDITEKVVYKALGKYVPVVPAGFNPPTIQNPQYPNNPTDPTKPGTPTTTIPYVPGTTPVGPDGQPLTPKVPGDPKQGYVPPVPTTPTGDTTIVYTKDGSQVAVTKFVDTTGKGLEPSVVDTGDTGKAFTKDAEVTAAINKILARGYEKVANVNTSEKDYPSTDAEKVFDADASTNQEYTVTFKPIVKDIPTDPTTPGYVKPEPGQPVVPGDNNGPKWPDSVKDLKTTESVTRTIKYIYDDGTPVPDAKLGADVPGKKVQTLEFTRTAKVNLVTGEIEYGTWTPKTTADFEAVTTPTIDGYTSALVSNPTTSDVPAKTVTADAADFEEVVVYKIKQITIDPNDPNFDPNKPVDPNNPDGLKYKDLKLAEEVKRTITYTYADDVADTAKRGTEAEPKHETTVSFTRTATVNAVTKEITYSEWTAKDNDTTLEGKATIPVKPGYVATGDVEASKKDVTGVNATDKDIVEKVIYKDLGKFVPVVPEGFTPPTIENPQYPNNPDDPTKPGTPTTTIPYVPGTTPVGPNGKPLTPKDPNDPKQGYNPPVPTNPTEDTTIVYTKDGSQVAVTHFIEVNSETDKTEKGGVAQSIVDTGDAGKAFTKGAEVTATIEALKAKGYTVVENNYPTDGKFDADSKTNQEFKVLVTVKPVTVNPNDPKPTPNKPIDPNNPTGPKWTPELIKELEDGRKEEVKRTINYVYADGKKAADSVQETKEFKRSATINPITGKITFGEWSPANQTFGEVTSPEIKNYTPNKATVPASEVTATAEDINETVVYTTKPITLDPSKPTDPNTPNVTPKPDDRVPNDPKGRTYKELGLIEEVTHTVHYKLEDGSDAGIADNVQTLTFTRTAEVDPVTGAISNFGTWKARGGDTTIDAVTTPNKDGYVASAKTSTERTNVSATDKDSEETIIYRKLGSYVPVVPEGITPPADADLNPKPYPNATPADPTKPGTPTETPVVPYIPGTTPVGPNGKPLTPKDPNNPTKGYEVPGLPTDPTENTTITYVKDGSQVAVVHFIEVNSETDKTEKGAVAESVVDTGDTGKVFTKAADVTSTIEALKAKGYTVVENNYPTDGTFDADSKTNQVYKVLVTAKPITVNPNDPTPTKDQPIDPNNPTGPKWTPELIKELEDGRKEEVKRTIKYVYADGSKAADSVQETKEFKRSATINPVTGKVTFGEWSPAQTFESVTSPKVTNFTPDKESVPAAEVTATAEDINETVIYTTKPANIDPSKPTDPNTPNVTPKPDDKVPNDPKGRTYKELGLIEEVTHTVHYKLADGSDAGIPDNVQTLTFTRTADLDPVTGAISNFGTWKAKDDDTTIDAVPTPAKEGYVASAAKSTARESVKATDKDSEETIIYRKLGSYVPVIPEGVTPPANTDLTPKPYPNDPNDPTKPGTPAETPVVPYIPGTTPVGPNGKPLTPKDPNDPTKGYEVPKQPEDPTQNTTITYVKDGSQVALVHFIKADGTAVHVSVAEAGDTGKAIKTTNIDNVKAELAAKGYEVVEPTDPAYTAERVAFYAEENRTFDDKDDKGDKGISQVYYVIVKEGITPIDPDKPLDPNNPNVTPKPGDKVPGDPKQRTYEQLGLLDEVNRTINYRYANTEKVDADKRGQEAAATVEQKLRYSRKGDLNKVTGEITYTSDWTEPQTLAEVISPVIEGYVADIKAAEKVENVAHDAADSVVNVVYSPLGKYVPKVPGGFEVPNIDKPQYPNDPKDPTKPGTPTTVIPHVPGTTPKDPNGNPLKPVDPNDPSKGYVPPTPTTPTEDTQITYEKDTQKAKVTYVVEGTGTVLHTDNLEGKSGEPIKYSTADKLADLKKLGYDLVTDGFTTATDKNYDKDTKVNQNFVVTVKPKVVDVPPFDPTNPNDPNTPKPGQPIDPENPNGPKWTEELIKSLDTTKHVNRTISYVKEDGSKVEYLDKDGNKSTADVTDKVTFTRDLKVNVVTGKIVDPNVAWTSKDTTFDAVKSPVAPGYVLKDATQKVVAETTGLTENSKDETIKVVYVPVGTWVPNVPKGETPIDPIPYPNAPTDPGKVVDPNDPTKPNDPNKPSVPVIPHIPGTTPKDPNGNPLKPVDPEDPTKGYVPPTPTTPTENTEINYEKDTQKAVTKFVDPSGNPIPGVTNIEETGKSGEPLTKATEVTTEIAKLIAKGYDLVSNNYGKDNNGNFDKDSGKDQEYTVVLIPHVEPIKPFDPTNPDDPNTPKPGQPIDPNNPNGPKWTEELINKLETTKHVTRKITYVEDGTDKEVADKATDKVTFTREAKINVVTGTIEYGKWTPVNNDTTFDKVTSPVVPGYVLKDPSQKEVDETTGLTENSKDETIKVVYVPVGKLVPKVPEGVTPPTPTPYDNDPQDPGKVVPPSPTKPTDPQDPNSPKVPVIPYIPGTTPKVPQDPTKPVDPNTNPLVPLKPVDPKDPSKGYEVPPVPTDPGTDTPIVYENDKQKAITNFVDNNGKVVSDPVVDQGDSGSKFTKSGDVESKIKELVKKGYVVTSNDYPSADTDRVFDNDKDKDQIFNVKVTPLIVPTDPNSPDQPQVPTDPTKPVGPNNPLKPVTPSTPEPGKPVFPEDPNSPVWPETVKDMVTETTATRTITYVDRNGKEVAATHTETIKFKRTAKVNLVTGDITYGEWIVVGNDTILDGNKLPKVDGYIARGGDIESSQKDIKATAGVNITERVVYDKLGSWIPKLPEGQTQVPPTPYPNDPTDPTKPGTDRPRVPYVPGFIPVDPNGNPLKPVDPNDPTKGYEVPVVPADPTQDTPIKYIPVPKPNNGGGNNGGGGGNTPTPQPQPNPTPQPEPSPAPNPVPVTPETPEQPVVPVAPEQPAEPATPQYMDGQRELPNTGTEAHSSLAALGLLGALSGFGLIARKKREDEE
ncbi:mucin-binding protein [Streptococcus mitis]|uniref:mucin-binding protein n=1 Tax=Streptococcus mitis TaxID=28037 RepID=UPI00178CB844|nr:GEVED domain-containing protein [Streptococcus mitis]